MRRPGFSLAETIVAWGLLATLLMLAVQLLPTCVTSYRQAGFQAHAESLGNSILEQQSAAFAGLRAGPLDPVIRDGVTYQPRLEVEAEPGFSESEARRLRLTIEWTERGHRHRWVRELVVSPRV